MKKKLLIILLATISLNTFSQNEIKARIEFEEAEKYFNENKFSEAITGLEKTEALIGKWTPKVGYLKIEALDKIVATEDFDNENTEKILKEVKLYMDFYSNEKESIIMDKFKVVYTIDERFKVLAKEKNFEKTPGFLEAEKAYNEKLFTKALEIWKVAASEGNFVAMDKISDMYRDAVGVNRDYKAALEWDTKAANLGYHISIADIGHLYYQGLGVAKNYDVAFDKFSKAAEFQLDYAMYYLANMYNNGHGVTRDDAKAYQWMLKAANKNYLPAMNLMAQYYQMGIHVAKDNTKAIEWHEKADQNGDRHALINIGTLYDQQLINPVKALEYYEKASLKGYPEGTAYAGYMYLYGKGVGTNHEKALHYFLTASDKGSKTAPYWLGRMYYYGNFGVKKDFLESAKWFELAVERGEKICLTWLKLLYETGGKGIKKDLTKAAQYQALYESQK